MLDQSDNNLAFTRNYIQKQKTEMLAYLRQEKPVFHSIRAQKEDFFFPPALKNTVQE